MTGHPARSSRPRAVMVLAVCLLMLSACAGNAAPTSVAGTGAVTGAPGNPAAGNPAAVASPAAAASCGNPAGATVGAAGGAFASILGAVMCGMPDIDPCSMLKPADVQALFSAQLGTSTTDHTGDCTWHLTDPSKGDGLDIVVNVGQGEGPLNQDMGLSDLTPITGIGDHASWGLLAGYFPHLGAVKGKATCELTAAGGNGQLSVPTTGKGVVAKIDDKALPGFMQQFGALCNEIFTGLGA